MMQTPRKYKYTCRHFIVELLFQSIHALAIIACSIGIALTFIFRSSSLNLKTFEGRKFFGQNLNNETISRLVTVVNEHSLITFIYMLALMYGFNICFFALWATISRKKSMIKIYAGNLGLIFIISVFLLFVIIYKEEGQNILSDFESSRYVF